MKNIFFAYIIAFGLFVGTIVHAQESLPDNVKINTTLGGGTSVTITGKPGYATSVSVNCKDTNCTHTANTTKISDKDIKKMQESFVEQQKAIQKMFEAQQEFFRKQNEIFKSLWGNDFWMF